ncbi:hypothetical protein B5D80_21395 [Micromonospora wenchangensis]|uniref:Uncharacterized protein n=1 Tax=Micromonospora wenchangensis TaxID=1185415 RepID=A0A246RIA3_9ACTN|nr:hypothetical protein [Micromonospora wenchangensis]OWV03870.1 hypothetical protein B5D80_21395 [Micromonospora wenchangensis]
MNEPRLRGGDLLHLTREASPQFVRPITVRVIRELTDRHTYDGWAWIEAYELGPDGLARRRRELYVRRAGVRRLPCPPPAAARPPAPRAATRSAARGLAVSA